jgi:carbonic anhydrase
MTAPRGLACRHRGGQRPFAVVLGCSDRARPQSWCSTRGWDLFVIRVAGNVVAPSGIGSVEFAVAAFGTPLVVVMGHTLCGAVSATVQALEQGDSPESKNLRSITDRIAPHVESLVRLAQRVPTERAVLLREAGRANLLASTVQLRHGSPLLERLVSAAILVVGAE